MMLQAFSVSIIARHMNNRDSMIVMDIIRRSNPLSSGSSFAFGVVVLLIVVAVGIA